jgi:protein SCO1/2
MTRRLPTFVLTVVIGTSACGWPSGERFHASSDARRFRLRGSVVGVDRVNGQLTIAHDRIDGYMDAMTMPFNLADARVMDQAPPGSRLLATLVVDADRSWLEAVSFTNRPVDAATLRRSFTAGPQPGDEIPDFHLTSEDGGSISIHQFRGKAVALTFIYVRCPLPDFCPFLSKNFATVERELRNWPRLDSNTQLLSVTLDPEHDTPEVLRKYRAAFIADAERSGNHWVCATGTPEQVKAITGFFGLQYWNETGQIDHSLRTVVVDAAGRITHIDMGNTWKPAGLIAELERAAFATPWR